MRFIVMPNMARNRISRFLAGREWHHYPRDLLEKRSLAMTTEKDIAPLLELLKMEANHWPYSGTGEISQDELFRRDRFLLDMWPEACRRTGVGKREFPSAVINLWKGGSAQPN
jgi:hypothetical protein